MLSTALVLAAALALPSPEQEDAPFLRWHWSCDAERLALGGYDPVAYHVVGEALEGREDLEREHEGLRYRFSDEETLARFADDPERYLPAFGGWCAVGLGLDPKALGIAQARIPADPTSFKLVDGRLLLFSRAPRWDARALWERSDEATLLARAEAFWAEREALAAKAGTCPAGFDPKAPLETLQFDFLIGAWDSTYVTRVDPASEQTVALRGEWTAWYGWHGYAVYDDWIQLGSPPNASGPAIRSYDPLNHEWVMHYIPINAPADRVWRITGRFDERGEMHGACTLVDPSGREFRQRIHFVDITETSFTWSSDRSYDGGETWIEGWGVGKNVRKTG